MSGQEKTLEDGLSETTDGDQVLCETGEECCGNHSNVDGKLETIPMMKAFGVDCLSDRQIFRWHKAFAEGREDVNDENRAGRPSTSSSNDMVRLISETLDITKTIVHEIVSETLGMRNLCAKLVPKVLTDAQKARRVETCQELLDTYEDNPAFLDDVIIWDESC
ncbi:hypothetical protein NQ318_016610 [Aromia moschata]|uniref:Uncharacterized protein n=1 Tax=Aromia moschata TaxID=1265417 RepID=A0AAV8X2W1_9CUCU|nr:hypothetical protein NQ318_016610 [Aromia moschata]